MSIGYMGYFKLGGTMYLATGSSVAEVISPIYSGAARGAGWKTSGTAFYADNMFQFEGNIDFELLTDMWSSLTDWIVDDRITAISLIVSPDGANIYTFTGGTDLAGAYNSSANFSTSEGSLVTCSVGVLGLTRTESTGTGYVANSTGETFIDYDPIAYWQSTVSIGGDLPTGTTPLDWSVDISNNPVVVYGCTGVIGPVAVLMGEAEVSGNVVLFNPSGVAALSLSPQEVVVDTGGGTLTLPRALIDNDGNDLSGGDSIISRSYSFKGLASDGKSPIEMS